MTENASVKKLSCSIIAFLFLAAAGISGAENAGTTFRSDLKALDLTGIWVIQQADGSTQISIGLRNAGTAPIKAFRSSIAKLNDFNEGEEVLKFEYTSESPYLAADGGRQTRHVLQPGDTTYYNFITFTDAPAQKYFSAVSFIHSRVSSRGKSKEEVAALEKELLGQGNFMLKVTDMVFSDADSLPRAQPVPKPEASAAEPPVVAPKAISPPAPTQPTADSPTIIGQSRTVTGVSPGDFLNVRSAPAMSSASLFQLSNDQQVQIRGDAVLNGETEWIPITFETKQGWVRSKYLKQ